MMHHLVYCAPLAIALISTQSCHSMEPKTNAKTKSVPMVACDHISACDNPHLTALVTAAEANAERGAAYLTNLRSTDKKTYETLTRILVLNDLDYAHGIETLSKHQNTNPNIAASDVSRLISDTAKGPVSGIGALVLLTPVSPAGRATQVTLLSTLKENGLVTTSAKGTPILSPTVLWGSVSGDAAYLGWNLNSIAHSHGTASKLQQATATAATYTEESTRAWSRLNAQDRTNILVAFKGLLKEIHLDYKRDIPKSGAAFAVLTQLNLDETSEEK